MGFNSGFQGLKIAGVLETMPSVVVHRVIPFLRLCRTAGNRQVGEGYGARVLSRKQVWVW